MKTLTVNGQQCQAEKIVKTDTDIIGYNGEQQVFAFKGIRDFSQFVLEAGEWDISEEAEEMMYFLDLDFRLSKIELGL